MSSAELFSKHIQRLQSVYEQALARLENSAHKAILLHSGSEKFYYSDDRSIAFQAYGHFLQWLPVNKPEQFVLIQRDAQPKFFQVIPNDFWYDQHVEMNSWWSVQFDIVQLSHKDQLVDHINPNDIVYLGEEPECISALFDSEIETNSAPVLHYLNYHRAYKTAYEVEQLRMANAQALKGHQASQDAFLAGACEFEIHHAYLNACNILENEAPYTNIVALNEKAAVLHYQNKRKTNQGESKVLLVDAGYRVNGYGSDITRTTINGSCNELFAELLKGMEKLEQELVTAVRPGISYVAIHDLALNKISQLLTDLKIISCEPEAAVEQQLTQLFMPHGIGHLLGIQVHDVAGFQHNEGGHTIPAPDYAPALRNTRMIEKDMVFTIEPGCYFIPMLLEPHRESALSTSFNWKAIDTLYPLGGIRVEDNILVTAEASENLTRG